MWREVVQVNPLGGRLTISRPEGGLALQEYTAGGARLGVIRRNMAKRAMDFHGRQGEARNEEAGSGAAQSGLVLLLLSLTRGVRNGYSYQKEGKEKDGGS